MPLPKKITSPFMIGAKRNETHQIAMMMFIRLRTIYS
jgi:hypothetical protein